jgi:Mrp family chromosome partitioning ATPase
MGSEKMIDILKLVKNQADLIIIDTPPVISVTDAVVLASRVDGVLLVVQPGLSKIGAGRQAIEELRRAGANIIGVVVNAVKSGDARYYYSGYYHYYYYSSPEDSHGTRHIPRNPLIRFWRSVWHPEKQPGSKPSETVVDDTIIEEI